MLCSGSCVTDSHTPLCSTGSCTASARSLVPYAEECQAIVGERMDGGTIPQLLSVLEASTENNIKILLVDIMTTFIKSNGLLPRSEGRLLHADVLRWTV